MDFRFEGKTILVTGAAQGIGQGLCLKLSKCGAKVIALDKLQNKLDDLKKKLPQVRTICVDLEDWQGIKNALKDIGPVDGLVNNAGVALNSPFFDITESEIDRTFNVNAKAIINVSQMVAKGMVERKKGAIVNISSTSSKRGFEEHTVYCGTKGAVDGLSRVMALELGKHNVRVNCVNPTVVLTPMGRACWSEPSKAESMLSRIPLGRFAEVEEVVNTVLFLLSDCASMINGVRLPVDGGTMASPYQSTK